MLKQKILNFWEKGIFENLVKNSQVRNFIKQQFKIDFYQYLFKCMIKPLKSAVKMRVRWSNLTFWEA